VPRKCTICNHKKRHQIDECLTKGTSYRDIARQYRVSKDALDRHVNKGHIAEKVKNAKEAEDASEALDLRKCAKEIYDLCLDSAKEAKKAKQFGAIGSCLQPAAKVIDILSKGEPQNINLNMSTDSDLDAKLERLVQKRKA